jgi:hypothetical protein
MGDQKIEKFGGNPSLPSLSLPEDLKPLSSTI